MEEHTRHFWLVSGLCVFLACSHPLVPPTDSGDAVGDAPGLDAAADAVIGADAAVADVLEIADSVDVPDTPPYVADVVKVADAKPDAGKALPLCPQAKGNCTLCNLCPAFPICTLKEVGKPDLTTYPNDCAAICALQAYNWPQEVGGASSIWQGECPACALCEPADMKTTTPYCVTLTSGDKVTVDHKCEAGCVPNVKVQADGVTPVASAGLCKSKCTSPVSTGGAGCPGKAQPICAVEDNATYLGTCQMEHCDVCDAAGEVTETAQCVPGKMTKKCDGACYDPVANATCPDTCDAVCGIKTTKLTNGASVTVGISYANGCLAALDGATIGSCAGISLTPNNPCAAGLYKGKGCCDEVQYGIIHPVCGSQTAPGKPDLFITFQNQAEYDCLTKGDPSWTFQYPEACVCNCNFNGPPYTCGGFTYANLCQAVCYDPVNCP